jgi:thioredoxin 1
MSQSIEITTSNFQTEVAESELPVLLDMWAAWCGPCRMVSPIVDELAGDYAGRIKVGKIDVDAEPAIAAAFGVQSIPTIVLIKDGQVVAQAIGARPKAQLAQALRLDEFAPAAVMRGGRRLRRH